MAITVGSQPFWIGWIPMDFRWRVPSDLVPMLEGPPSVYEENPCLASKYDGGLSVVGAMFRNGKKRWVKL